MQATGPSMKLGSTRRRDSAARRRDARDAARRNVGFSGRKLLHAEHGRHDLSHNIRREAAGTSSSTPGGRDVGGRIVPVGWPLSRSPHTGGDWKRSGSVREPLALSRAATENRKEL